jgi:hypothetical protein
MTTVSGVNAQNIELYKKAEIRKLEQRHTALLEQERLIKHQKEVNEQQRIEMNRRMNRAGQNVDRMA